MKQEHCADNNSPSAALMPAPDTMLDSPARSTLREAAIALDLAERHRAPIEMCLALAQMGRCYRALNAPQPAQWVLQDAYRWAGLLGAADQAVELLCQLAELSCEIAAEPCRDDLPPCRAALEQARDRAFEIAALAPKVSDPQWEIKALLRASDVLDRCGDHDDAVQLQSRAMRLIYSQSLQHNAPRIV